MCDDFKFDKLGSKCYSCLLALTPYDFNVPNTQFKKIQWKEISSFHYTFLKIFKNNLKIKKKIKSLGNKLIMKV